MLFFMFYGIISHILKEVIIMLKPNLNFFFSTIANGNMNTNKAFYPENMTKEEIRKDFNERRIKLGKDIGYCGLKVLTPIQKSRPVLIGKTDEEKNY